MPSEWTDRLRGRDIDIDAWSQTPDAHRCKSIAAFADSIAHELYTDPHAAGSPLPWPKTHRQFRMRPSELTMWAGPNASFKSMLISHVMIDRAHAGERVCIASLEMTCAKAGRRMALQAHAGVPSREQLDAWLDSISEHITLYDLTGNMTAKAALAVMRYAAAEIGCSHFVLDNLTKIVSASNDAAEEQQRFANDVQRIAIETGMHIHVVAHTRKPAAHAEDRPPNRYEIRGSSTISDQCDNALMIWRNRAKEAARDRGDSSREHEPDLLLTVDKQRHGAWEGPIQLWLDRRALSFTGGADEGARLYAR